VKSSKSIIQGNFIEIYLDRTFRPSSPISIKIILILNLGSLRTLMMLMSHFQRPKRRQKEGRLKRTRKTITNGFISIPKSQAYPNKKVWELKVTPKINSIPVA
jgi:hypothetical protein